MHTFFLKPRVRNVLTHYITPSLTHSITTFTHPLHHYIHSPTPSLHLLTRSITTCTHSITTSLHSLIHSITTCTHPLHHYIRSPTPSLHSLTHSITTFAHPLHHYIRSPTPSLHSLTHFITTFAHPLHHYIRSPTPSPLHTQTQASSSKGTMSHCWPLWVNSRLVVLDASSRTAVSSTGVGWATLTRWTSVDCGETHGSYLLGAGQMRSCSPSSVNYKELYPSRTFSTILFVKNCVQ